MSGWDRPAVAAAYGSFCAEHDRYARANRELCAAARLDGARRVLDVGAGLGGTAACALPSLGDDAAIVCVEPAAAMRAASRVADPRVMWTAALPARGGFDRVLCGASIWLLGDVRAAVAALAPLVAPGGALVFDIPAAYLGEPDPPGGGRDPYLTAPLAQLVAAPPADGAAPRPTAPRAAAAPPALPTPDAVDAALAAAGLAPQRWGFERRMSRAELRDWLCVPVLTDGLLAGVEPDERARRVRAAFAAVDPGSWRVERWRGWTAWR